jgi:hypothetical protein
MSQDSIACSKKPTSQSSRASKSQTSFRLLAKKKAEAISFDRRLCLANREWDELENNPQSIEDEEVAHEADEVLAFIPRLTAELAQKRSEVHVLENDFVVVGHSETSSSCFDPR